MLKKRRWNLHSLHTLRTNFSKIYFPVICIITRQFASALATHTDSLKIASNRWTKAPNWLSITIQHIHSAQIRNTQKRNNRKKWLIIMYICYFEEVFFFLLRLRRAKTQRIKREKTQRTNFVLSKINISHCVRWECMDIWIGFSVVRFGLQRSISHSSHFNAHFVVIDVHSFDCASAVDAFV